MQMIKRFFVWYSDTFRKQKLAGKVVFGCVSVFVLCCLCSVPIGILNPTTPTPEVRAIIIPSVTETVLPSLTPTPTLDFRMTAIVLALTGTVEALSTEGVLPSPVLPSPVATVTTFLSILPANNPTQTLSPIMFTETPLPTLEPFASPTIESAGSSNIVIIAVNKRAEYVDIKNNGTIPQDLSGWQLVSETGNQNCLLSGIIQPGEVLRIFAMSSTDPGFYCGYRKEIWNNSKSDPAVLYNAQGKEVSRD